MREKIRTEVKKQLKSFEQECIKRADALSEKTDKFLKAAENLGEAWSGSFAGYHGRLYYKNFFAPPLHERFSVEWGGLNGIPNGWSEKTADQVKHEIETRSGVLVDDLEKDGKSLNKLFERLHEEVLINLSIYSFVAEEEKECVNKIKELKPQNRNELIYHRMPKQIGSRDSEAVYQGMCTPAHLYYEGVAWEMKSLCETTSQLIKYANRLARFLEANKVVPRQKTLSNNHSPLTVEEIKKISIWELPKIFTLGSLGVLITILTAFLGAGVFIGRVWPDDVSKRVALLVDQIPKLENQRNELERQINSLKSSLPENVGPDVRSRINKIQELNIASSDTVNVIAGITQNLRKDNNPKK